MYQYTYIFPAKANKWHYKEVCKWIKEHPYHYLAAGKKAEYTKLFENEFERQLEISLEKNDLTVNSEDDLAEYFDDKFIKNRSEIEYQCDRNKRDLTLISFGAYALEIILPIMAVIAFSFLGVYGMLAFAVLPAVVITTLTYKSIYERCGSLHPKIRTMFVQSGGIFAAIPPIVLLALFTLYSVYKKIKESYVIPNFTVEQICAARNAYNNIDAFTFIIFLIHLFTVPAALVISELVRFIKRKIDNAHNSRNAD